MAAEALSSPIHVEFFRPSLTDAEIDEVVNTLRSGWLTTGPKVKRFQEEFASFVNAKYAVAVNSCTSALQLAMAALHLRPGEAVLVPTMTFAATAEVVIRHGAFPLLVDCDPETLNMDTQDAERKIEMLRDGRLPGAFAPETKIAGIVPVHVGGMMMDGEGLVSLADRYDLWVVEDAAHAFPSARLMQRRLQEDKGGWQRCGDGTASISCFSFYANKAITTGEGGMAVTNDKDLADRILRLSLHGLSEDAWKKHSGGNWEYEIVEPGYKCNLTDIAAAIGIHQLARAEQMRRDREKVARFYLAALAEVEEVDLPLDRHDRIHAWHLFPIRLRLDRLSIDRNEFIKEMQSAGVSCSVHWRPLHLHRYYRQTFRLEPEHFPVASAEWCRLVSLPIFPGMRDFERSHVVETVKRICQANAL